jgi:hypothetical protein
LKIGHLDFKRSKTAVLLVVLILLFYYLKKYSKIICIYILGVHFMLVIMLVIYI